MNKTREIHYTYDPGERLLTIWTGSRKMGSFKGGYAEQRFYAILDSGVEINLVNMNKTSSHSHKVRRIRAIWNKLGIDQHRESILLEYGVSSTADLSEQQLDELISFYGQPSTAVSPKMRALRSDLLCICQRMGIYVTNDDWSRVNAFFMDKRIAGKLLNKLSCEEMEALIPKLRSIESKHHKQMAELNRQQREN